MQDSHFIAAGALASAIAVLGAVLGGANSGETATAPAPLPVVVGAVADKNAVHLLERPGLYGLGSQPAEGHGQYAIVDNSLVRVDPATMVVRSVIRRDVHLVTGLSP